MPFANDIILEEESREELNEKLALWRQAFQVYGFHISRSKMKYMKCEFSKRCINSNIEVKIGDNTIPQVTRFKYFGSIIQNDGEID